MKELRDREEEITETKDIKVIREVKEVWDATIAKTSVTSPEIAKMKDLKEESSAIIAEDKATLLEIVLNKIDLNTSKFYSFLNLIC